MKKRQLRKLLKRYRNGKGTGEEKALVEGWYNYYAGLKPTSLPHEDLLEEDLQRIWNHISAEQVPVRKIRRLNYSAAASIAALLLISLFTAIYFIGSSETEKPPRTAAPYPLFLKHGMMQGIGVYDAYVELGSGVRINLDSVRSGKTLSYDKINLSKEVDGTIVYQPGINNWDAITASLNIHTVHVPKAKQSKLVLSDGTKVWLNSESSISFPEAFAWNERQVEVSGEVYFEVTKDAAKPFYVKTKDAVIKVLGTSFNISAYPDEQVSSTTLVTGSVNVFASTEEGKPLAETNRTLVPGQQWALNKNNQHVSVRVVDLEDIIAWKDGLISFTNLDLQTIMKKAARWYDVEIEYKSYNQERRFTGGISSRTTLDEFIRIMGLYQVKIEREGDRRLIVNGN